MGRIRAYVVSALVAASFGLVGCGPPDLPRDLYVDSRFTPEEQAVILAQFAEWNRVGREYLGMDEIVRYQGLFTDDDSFKPQDFGDTVSLIYRIDAADPANAYFHDGPHLTDKSTWGDVVIFMAPFTNAQGQVNLPKFGTDVLHGMGHFLGAGHVPDDPTAVMYWKIDDSGTVLNANDVRALCRVRDCVKDP